MAKQGKLVLARIVTKENIIRLEPVTVVGVDQDTWHPVVDHPIQLSPESELSLTVPRESLFEFDPQLMEVANNLMQGAHDKISAAMQLMDLELVPAEIETPVDEQMKALGSGGTFH